MAASKIERRSRAEIDRNYFFGDIFIRAGAAALVAVALIAAATPFSLSDAVAEGMVGYIAVMAGFGLFGIVVLLYGRHLRRSATHWDKDD
ncbi:MAG: hypothetical protein HXY28_11245 [Hydrogenophilaceae bacterium]|jgi:hypothetical protein|nr:hypothetical protein [Hydrogenophilaceae bacterium]